MNSDVGIIGAGNMGYAIIKGLYDAKTDVRIFAFDTDGEKLKRLGAMGVKALKSEAETTGKCKYIVLAVKPQIFEPVLDKIKDAVTEETVIISIAAGISAGYIRSRVGKDVKIALVMPNTPFLVGEGASAIAKAGPISGEEFEFVKLMFRNGGEVVEIAPDKMKEIIAVNGSSPAFIYLFAKAFADYAESEGISRGDALSLFSKTLIGSAKMITESGYGIDELIKMVSSPGGTTVAGLDGLYKGRFSETVLSACKRCTERAYELSGEKKA